MGVSMKSFMCIHGRLRTLFTTRQRRSEDGDFLLLRDSIFSLLISRVEWRWKTHLRYARVGCVGGTGERWVIWLFSFPYFGFSQKSHKFSRNFCFEVSSKEIILLIAFLFRGINNQNYAMQRLLEIIWRSTEKGYNLQRDGWKRRKVKA